MFDREFDFPEPPTPVANDDDEMALGPYHRANRSITKNQNYLNRAIVFAVLIPFAILIVTLALYPAAFLALDITPILVIASAIPLLMITLLIFALVKLNQVALKIDNSTTRNDAENQFRRVQYSIDKVMTDIDAIKLGLLNDQKYVVTKLNALEAGFDKISQWNAEMLRAVNTNVNTTTHAHAQLIDKKLTDISALVKVAQNDKISTDDVFARHNLLAEQIVSIDKQIKSLSSQVSQKFYETGSVKDVFEKLLNGYLDQINKRSDLVIKQLDHAVNSSRDISEKMRSDLSSPEILATSKKLTENLSLLERRLSQKIEMVDDLLRNRTAQIDADIQVSRYAPSKSSRHSEIQNSGSPRLETQAKFTTQTFLETRDKKDSKIEESKSDIGKAIDRNNAELLTDAKSTTKLNSSKTAVGKIATMSDFSLIDDMAVDTEESETIRQPQQNSFFGKMFRK